MTSSAPGVAWAIAAGLAFGVGQIANRGVNRHMPAIAASTAMLSAVLIALLAASAIVGDLGDVATMTPAAAGWYIAATVIHFGIGWTLFVVSQQRIGPSRTASVLSANPVVAALVAAMVIGEQLRSVTWLGVVLVAGGVAVVALRPPTHGGVPSAVGIPPTASGPHGEVSRAGATAPGGGAGEASDPTGRRPDVASADGGDGRLTGVGTHRSARWAALWPALAATLMFSVSPLPVREGLERFAEPRLGLLVGLMATVPLMHGATRLLSGGWAPIGSNAVRWLALGGSAAAVAITAQWTALDLIPVGAAISLQQLNTPTVLVLGPVLLRAPAERPTVKLLFGTGLILAGAILVALFGRSAG